MSTLRPTLVLISLLALAACGTPTPYAPAAGGGYGYGTQRLEDGRFRVSFSGNALTPRRTVETFLLYRAAEVTLQQGGDYFVTVRRDTDADTSWYTTYDAPPWYPGYGYYPWHRPWHEGTTRPVTRFEAHAEILVRRGAKPPDDTNAFDARSVIRNLRPEIERLNALPG